MTSTIQSPTGLGIIIYTILVINLTLISKFAIAAPLQESVDIQEYSEGCYYNYNHYNEGDRISTNEPCLNCTCHNKMLMCYLRVCPFTKPIGHDCVVEKREDQCCPIITCPEVPVELSQHVEPGTELAIPEKYGCTIDNKFYMEGAQVPAHPNKPCELCYCIKNRTSCLMQECTLHIDGCQPIYNKDSCCPVRYNCDHENELTDESYFTTTVRPTTGFMLTTMSSLISAECYHDNNTYPDGSQVRTKNSCENCYCMHGDIVCAVQKCDIPTMEVEGKVCKAGEQLDGECCPSNYICEGITEKEGIAFIPESMKEISNEDVELQTHIDKDTPYTEKDDTKEKEDSFEITTIARPEDNVTSETTTYEDNIINKLRNESQEIEKKTELPLISNTDNDESYKLQLGDIPMSIPGEGSCLLDGETYSNNTRVATSNECEEYCTCISSVVTCKAVECDSPPSKNCYIDVENKLECCPVYICNDDQNNEVTTENQPTSNLDNRNEIDQLTTLSSNIDNSTARSVESSTLDNSTKDGIYTTISQITPESNTTSQYFEESSTEYQLSSSESADNENVDSISPANISKTDDDIQESGSSDANSVNDESFATSHDGIVNTEVNFNDVTTAATNIDVEKDHGEIYLPPHHLPDQFNESKSEHSTSVPFKTDLTKQEPITEFSEMEITTLSVLFDNELIDTTPLTNEVESIMSSHSDVDKLDSSNSENTTPYLFQENHSEKSYVPDSDNLLVKEDSDSEIGVTSEAPLSKITNPEDKLEEVNIIDLTAVVTPTDSYSIASSSTTGSYESLNALSNEKHDNENSSLEITTEHKGLSENTNLFDSGREQILEEHKDYADSTTIQPVKQTIIEAIHSKNPEQMDNEHDVTSHSALFDTETESFTESMKSTNSNPLEQTTMKATQDEDNTITDSPLKSDNTVDEVITTVKTTYLERFDVITESPQTINIIDDQITTIKSIPLDQTYDEVLESEVTEKASSGISIDLITTTVKSVDMDSEEKNKNKIDSESTPKDNQSNESVTTMGTIDLELSHKTEGEGDNKNKIESEASSEEFTTTANIFSSEDKQIIDLSEDHPVEESITTVMSIDLGDDNNLETEIEDKDTINSEPSENKFNHSITTAKSVESDLSNETEPENKDIINHEPAANNFDDFITTAKSVVSKKTELENKDNMSSESSEDKFEDSITTVKSVESDHSNKTESENKDNISAEPSEDKFDDSITTVKSVENDHSNETESENNLNVHYALSEDKLDDSTTTLKSVYSDPSNKKESGNMVHITYEPSEDNFDDYTTTVKTVDSDLNKSENKDSINLEPYEDKFDDSTTTVKNVESDPSNNTEFGNKYTISSEPSEDSATTVKSADFDPSNNFGIEEESTNGIHSDLLSESNKLGDSITTVKSIASEAVQSDEKNKNTIDSDLSAESDKIEGSITTMKSISSQNDNAMEPDNSMKGGSNLESGDKFDESITTVRSTDSDLSVNIGTEDQDNILEESITTIKSTDKPSDEEEDSKSQEFITTEKSINSAPSTVIVKSENDELDEIITTMRIIILEPEIEDSTKKFNYELTTQKNIVDSELLESATTLKSIPSSSLDNNNSDEFITTISSVDKLSNKNDNSEEAFTTMKTSDSKVSSDYEYTEQNTDKPIEHVQSTEASIISKPNAAQMDDTYTTMKSLELEPLFDHETETESNISKDLEDTPTIANLSITSVNQDHSEEITDQSSENSDSNVRVVTEVNIDVMDEVNTQSIADDKYELTTVSNDNKASVQAIQKELNENPSSEDTTGVIEEERIDPVPSIEPMNYQIDNNSIEKIADENLKTNEDIASTTNLPTSEDIFPTEKLEQFDSISQNTETPVLAIDTIVTTTEEPNIMGDLATQGQNIKLPLGNGNSTISSLLTEKDQPPKNTEITIDRKDIDSQPAQNGSQESFTQLPKDEFTSSSPTVSKVTESSPTNSSDTDSTASSIPQSTYNPLPQSGMYAPPQYSSYSEDEYTDEDEGEIFGPGTCRYGGKLYVSAQQIPRDDPCDFCFCFRSDIICLQQSCPPPISGCREEPIHGFCCPRYECPVSMGTVMNITTSTTTTSTTLPPHFLTHNYQGSVTKSGCFINGATYAIGDEITSSSGPCMQCLCGGDGQMKCIPKSCSPEPFMRQMVAQAISKKR